MAPGPITYQEIEAYLRLSGDELTLWEVGLIRRLDRAALRVTAEQAPKPSDKTGKTVDAPAAPREVAMNDTAGVKSLFSKFPRKPNP